MWGWSPSCVREGRWKIIYFSYYVVTCWHRDFKGIFFIRTSWFWFYFFFAESSLGDWLEQPGIGMGRDQVDYFKSKGKRAHRKFVQKAGSKSFSFEISIFESHGKDIFIWLNSLFLVCYSMKTKLNWTGAFFRKPSSFHFLLKSSKTSNVLIIFLKSRANCASMILRNCSYRKYVYSCCCCRNGNKEICRLVPSVNHFWHPQKKKLWFHRVTSFFFSQHKSQKKFLYLK